MEKRNRRLALSLFSIFLLALIASCGGSGNSPGNTRDLTGTLSSAKAIPSSSAFNENMTFADSDISLGAVTVIATATDGTSVTTQTDADGAFTLPLVIGRSYVISFAQGDMFIGTLIVSLDQAGNFSSRGFKVTAGDGDVELGRVTCSAGVCRAELNPNCEFDDDEDGQANCEDDDFEDRHPDFDHDGLCDEDEDEDHFDSHSCEVIALEPFNGEMGVELNEEIELRFSSAVDFATVDGTSLFLTDTGGAVVPAAIFAEDSEEGREVELAPLSPLVPLSNYTLHVFSTIQCLNGLSPSGDLEIHFMTGTTSD